jgi:cobalt-zinc-cadmium efflux system protein
MGHHHHGHTHHHSSSENIKIAFLLNISFALIEVIGGIYTNSMAVLSDALHDAGDSMVLGLAWYFSYLSQRKSDDNYTFGYGRFSVLGALINAIILIAGGAFIIWESLIRLWNPEPAKTVGMMALAIIGVCINGIAAWRLQKGSSHNERMVSLHLIEDVLGWVTVLIGAIVMHFTNAIWLDPVLSLGIAFFIVTNTFRNVREPVNIILQRVPKEIDTVGLQQSILSVQGVESLNDFRCWTIDGEEHVVSLKLTLYDPSIPSDTLSEKIRDLCQQVNIKNVTVEILNHQP